jgi:hypothetical protein
MNLPEAAFRPAPHDLLPGKSQGNCFHRDTQQRQEHGAGLFTYLEFIKINIALSVKKTNLFTKSGSFL